MPYRICKNVEIKSGRALALLHKENRSQPESSLLIEVTLEADQLDENGVVCDFKVLEEVIGDSWKKFDHTPRVNPHSEQGRELGNIELTTEALAKTLFDDLRKKLNAYACDSTRGYDLRQDVRLIKVRVWANSSSWAEYEHPRVYDTATAVDRINDIYIKYLKQYFPSGFTSWSGSHGGPFWVNGEVKDADIFIEVRQRHSPKDEVPHPNEPVSIPGGKFYTLINFGYEDRDWQVIRAIVSAIDEKDIFIKLPDSLKQLTPSEALAFCPLL